MSSTWASLETVGQDRRWAPAAAAAAASDAAAARPVHSSSGEAQPEPLRRILVTLEASGPEMVWGGGAG
jgi:hypothetical protein